MQLIKNISLKNLNTFKIDAKAKFFCEITNKEDILKLSDEGYFQRKWIILGGGSNVLFTDDFDGIVIKNKISGFEVLSKDEDKVIIKANAGELWDNFVDYCVSNSFYGAENLSLIPGTVGASPIQNIGAYGTEVSDIIYSVEYFDIENRSFKTIEKSFCKFGYRESIFKNELKNKFIITSVNYNLCLNPHYKLNYKPLSQIFADQEKISLSEIRNKIIEIRTSKLPDTEILGNAGSFFKNPEISNDELEGLKREYNDIIYFETDSGNVKIPAGWLIEKAGLKGFRKGNVGTYNQQALVILNFGGATGKEIIEFSEFIRAEVLNKFKINLTPEVNIII